VSISTRTRFEILKRDGFRCRYCGATAVDVLLHVDHVVPRAGGGTDDAANLITACADCNLGKSDVPLDESRLRHGPAPEDAHEHAAQVREYLEAVKEVEAAKEELSEYIADYWREQMGCDPLVVWYRALRSMTTTHPVERILRAIDATAAKRPYSDTAKMKYFYGCLRRMAERDGGGL
jgi:hypothetical protein